MADTKRVNVILPVAQIDMLKKIAKSTRRDFSSVLREAIEDYTGVRDTVQRGGTREKDYAVA